MITKKSDPVSWALMMHDLEDAHEDLGALMAELADADDDDTRFRIRLAHIYAHLNHAWNSRNAADEAGHPEWPDQTQFPSDVEPA